jgi:hypothetical protein
MGPKDRLPDLTHQPPRRIAANASRAWSARASFPAWAISVTVSLSAAGAAIFRSLRLKSNFASVTVRDLALAVAGLAFDGVDFAAGLHRLHHCRETRSIAFRAGMLLDLRPHVQPFSAPQLVASLIIGQTCGRSLTLLGHGDDCEDVSSSGQSASERRANRR